MDKASVRNLIFRLRIRVAPFVLAAVLILADPSWGSIAIGAVICFLGLFIRAWAAGHIRKEKELAVAGPYRFTRNPLYLGSFILGLGLAVGTRSYWGLGIFLFYFLAFYPVVIIEERDRMRRLFAAAYVDYERRVPVFIPTLRGSKANDPRPWDPALFKRNKEIRAWIGTGLVWILVMIRMGIRG